MDLSKDEAIAAIKKQVAVDVVRRLREALGNPAEEGVELPTPDAHLLPMYARTRSLFSGISELLEADLAGEAMILARPLFTESLWLQHSAAVGDDRHSYVLGWVLDSLNRRERLFREGHRVGLTEDLLTALKVLGGEREKVRRYMKRHRLVQKKFPNEKRLAALYGRDEDYWAYEFAHQLVHGSEVAHLWRTERREGLLIVAMEGGREGIEAGVARFAGHSILHSHAAALRLFADSEFQEFGALWEELDHCTEV